MGVTGSGKTFTMANVIARLHRPTLVISHNKTLAAQLYEEFKELFPNNAVGYFVSYYDYYQPEAYIPQRDIYIEKDASRNDDLDRLRLSATSNLVSRRDVHAGRVGELHLRPGLARGIPQQRAAPSASARRSTATRCSAADRPAVHPQRHGLQARHLPRPRRRGRAAPLLRGVRLPHRVLRRRDQLDRRDQSADRRAPPRGAERSSSTRPSTTSCPRTSVDGGHRSRSRRNWTSG